MNPSLLLCDSIFNMQEGFMPSINVEVSKTVIKWQMLGI